MRISVAALLLSALASLQAARAIRYATREEVPKAQVNAEGVYVIKVEQEEDSYVTWHLFMSESGQGVYFYNPQTESTQWHDPRTSPSQPEGEHELPSTGDTAIAGGKTYELELGAGLDTITSTAPDTQAGDGSASPPKDTDSQGPADTTPETATAAASTNEQKSASSPDLKTEDDEAEYYFEFPADFSVLGNSASLLMGGAGLGIVLVSFVLGKVLRRRFERHKIDRAPRTRLPSKQQTASADTAAAGANSAPEGSPARSTHAARRRAA